MKSAPRTTTAERIMVLVGVLIMTITILQGVLIFLILKGDFRQWATARMESVLTSTLHEMDGIRHAIGEDAALILANPALPIYFTARAFADYDEMTDSVASFEIYLKQVFRSKPDYRTVQLAGADGAPILQLTAGERVESFDLFSGVTGQPTTYAALFGAKIPGQHPLVRTFGFQDDRGKWLLLTVVALAYEKKPEGLLWISKEIEGSLSGIATELAAMQTTCAIVDSHGRLIIVSAGLEGKRLAGFLSDRLPGWQILERRIPVLDWVVKVGMPEAILFALLRKAIMVWLFASGVALAVAMASLWVFKRHQQTLEEKVARQNRDLIASNQQLNETLASFEEAKEELTVINNQIDGDRTKLQAALDEIFALIRKVTEEKKFGIYFTPSQRRTCWEATGCTNTECVCYDAPDKCCWETVGSFRKEGDAGCGQCSESFRRGCEQCQFYLEVTTDPIFRIGEAFNNMMRILQGKSEELEKAYADLKLSHSRILQQEKMASIGQLAAGVAHEINNPIGFISSNLGTMGKYTERLVGYVEELSTLVRTSPAGDDIGEELDRLRKQYKVGYIVSDFKNMIAESQEGTERVKGIVANLKSFSRVDQAVIQEVDIHECLDSTINIVWNEIKYKAELRREYGQVPLLRCYPQQLNQVFMNLLVNAAQAIPEKGVITVHTREEQQSIIVAISDTGQGISEENLLHLFEPFFTTKEVGKGTGLGLSIAYDIITKQHKGEITVQSSPGQGSTFTIRLPLGGVDA